jgi:hypothetical protein
MREFVFVQVCMHLVGQECPFLHSSQLLALQGPAALAAAVIDAAAAFPLTAAAAESSYLAAALAHPPFLHACYKICQNFPLPASAEEEQGSLHHL